VTLLELIDVGHGPLLFAAGGFVPACTVVTGDDAAALATFAAVTSGALAPRRGRVLFDGAPLVRTPAARRRVASLLATESLPPAASVEVAVARVLAARHDDRGARDVLAPYGLAAWCPREPGELDHDELRALALALAFTHDKASALVLHEPLVTSALAPAAVREAVARAVERGMVVVLVTASRTGAASFGGPHCSIARGVLATAPNAAATEHGAVA
jgi:ABC-type thiamine transport system ATPase subunit